MEHLAVNRKVLKHPSVQYNMTGMEMRNIYNSTEGRKERTKDGRKEGRKQAGRKEGSNTKEGKKE